jgi:hypothetical protein
VAGYCRSSQAECLALLADRADPRPASARAVRHFFSTDQFFADAGNGELPTYAFIEPQIVGHAHNDMHPAFSMLTPGLNFDPPSSLIAGEDLLGRVYDAIRTSPPTSPRF